MNKFVYLIFIITIYSFCFSEIFFISDDYSHPLEELSETLNMPNYILYANEVNLIDSLNIMDEQDIIFCEKNIPFTDIASAKLFCSEMVSRIADRALHIMGGMGYIEDYSDVPRLYRDVRLFRIFEGSSQIQQNTISKFMMKNYLTLNKM